MLSWQRRGRRPAILLSLSILSHALTVSAIWPLSPSRYTSTANALVDGGSLGLGESDGRVVAFGDFNADQYLDLIALSADQRTATVYLWDHEQYLFQKGQSFVFPHDVSNIVPGDFSYDGRLDLLVMAAAGKGQWWDGNEENAMSLYLGVGNGAFSDTPLSVPSSTLAQPIVADVTGDLKLDLLGLTLPTATGAKASLRMWKNVWNASDSSTTMFSLGASPLDPSTVCSFSNPHSAALVDLDGDCLADLFLVCDTPSSSRKTYQIWLNSKVAGFTLAREGLLPQGAGAITFADMDRDGTIDLVFPTCASVSATGIGADCAINIAYNRQLPLCSSSSSFTYQEARGACRKPDELCSSDSSFAFDFDNWQDNDAFSRIPLSSLSPNYPTSLLLEDHSFNPPLPVALRVADMSLSGFPSILAVLAGTNSGGFLGIGSNVETSVELLDSFACTSGVAGCEGGKGQAGRRALRPATVGVDVLASIKDARGVAVVDLDEDGTLDILVQRTGTQSRATVTFLRNNIFHDAFFLKAIVLNGACSGWCQPSDGERYQPFGSSSPGASYKYTILDTSGRRSAAQVAQLPQTSYQALHTPYSYLGLGRTNNYVENLFVGSTKHQEQHFINIEGVIPNSRVVINPSSDNGVWNRELFLRPGDWIPWVTLTAIAATIILAVIVLILHINEKREDERERRKAVHNINFDAL